MRRDILTMHRIRASRGARAICFAIAGMLLCHAPAVPGGQPAPPEGLDAYVETVRERFEVPGIGLAVVKDGQVVVAKGYGLRELGKPQPVDERTLFPIASNTKAFTAAALALLVEEGKLEWDAPVLRYLPWFQLADPYVTREITVRDLLVHRSGLGLGAGDLLWWPDSTYSRSEIVRRLRHLPLASGFRSRYAYDNVLYLAAGEVIEAVSGQSWEDFVAARILARIGMRDSNALHSKAGSGRNTAKPHARIDNAVQQIGSYSNDATNPAGGINASARDMAKWLLVLLDAGRLGGDARLFSERTARELTTLVTPIPIGDAPCGLAPLQPRFSGYALGLGVRDYRGHKMVTHGGGMPGHVSRVTMLPDLRLGVVVLTNQEAGGALGAITQHILDAYLGVADTDWLVALKECETRRYAQIEKMEQETAAQRNADSRPSLPLEAYAGTYRDAWYGDIVVERKEGGGLRLRFTQTPSLAGDMEHWQYDTFLVRWPAFRGRSAVLRGDALVTFALDAEGRIDQVRLKAASPATDFSFNFQDLLLKPVRQENAE